MNFIKRNKYTLTLIVLALLIVSIIITKKKLNNQKYDIIVNNEENELKKADINKTEETNKIDLCTVDIKGAINNPGVYTSECTKYIYDIIELAGGLKENADTSIINLAKRITNEMVIIIYTKEEVTTFNNENNNTKAINTECVCPKISNDSSINKATNDIQTGLIDINKATIEQLKSLPGIGETKAKDIIEYRNKIGSFNNIEEIKNVSGIGEKLYEKIKEYITT